MLKSSIVSILFIVDFVIFGGTSKKSYNHMQKKHNQESQNKNTITSYKTKTHKDT